MLQQGITSNIIKNEDITEAEGNKQGSMRTYGGEERRTTP
jgi:hypothetical protein